MDKSFCVQKGKPSRKVLGNKVLATMFIIVLFIGWGAVLTSAPAWAATLSVTPSATVLSPNGGETFTSAGSMTVKWGTSQDYACKTIVLYLFPQVGTPIGNGYISVANGYNIGGKSYTSSCSTTALNQELTTVIPSVPAGSYKVGVYVFEVG